MSCGIAKWFLQENDVYVNGEVDDDRCGRKLRDGGIVNISGCGRFRIVGTYGQ